MKTDAIVKLYKRYGKQYGVGQDYIDVNKRVKAVIVNFGDNRGDIIVTNDNYGTRRKYPDFTEGRKAAGLHPLQIVFSGMEFARICHDRYIGPDDKVHTF